VDINIKKTLQTALKQNVKNPAEMTALRYHINEIYKGASGNSLDSDALNSFIAATFGFSDKHALADATRRTRKASEIPHAIVQASHFDMPFVMLRLGHTSETNVSLWFPIITYTSNDNNDFNIQLMFEAQIEIDKSNNDESVVVSHNYFLKRHNQRIDLGDDDAVDLLSSDITALFDRMFPKEPLTHIAATPTTNLIELLGYNPSKRLDGAWILHHVSDLMIHKIADTANRITFADIDVDEIPSVTYSVGTLVTYSIKVKQTPLRLVLS